MLKIISALGIAALLVTGLSAGKPASGPTFTFDADGSVLPVAAAAADWSKNTDITVRTGDCTGAGCVHFKVVDTIPCNWSTFIAGCAYSLPEGACQVEVHSSILGRVNLTTMVTKHEAGHCVFKFGGKPVNLHLPDEPHALMSAVQPGAPGKNDATLTSIDREFTRSLF